MRFGGAAGKALFGAGGMAGGAALAGMTTTFFHQPPSYKQ